ncbi:hypothetical protein MA16_Dca020626 [Dendrobium catenatum]|uniref:Uncharacterized protein n=1 Tax=Dendrobium catenatum TaxID=906689 RepID=A0A2I0W397_9ASPA|nr:hypothetical protein MA16_Dca020626 [Dendrobium catenatum]
MQVVHDSLHVQGCKHLNPEAAITRHRIHNIHISGQKASTNIPRIPPHMHHNLYAHRCTKGVNTITIYMGPDDRVMGIHVTSRDAAWAK